MTDKAPPKRVKKWRDMSKDGYTADERKELRRNLVRVMVTYAAAGYLFLFGPVMVWILYKSPTSATDNFIAAKDMYMALLPIASGIVAYWFATRQTGSDKHAEQNRQDSEDKNGSE